MNLSTTEPIEPRSPKILGLCAGQVCKDAIANPTSSFCGNNSRSASEEGIENQIAARRAIHNCVRYERNRFNRRMEGNQVSFTG